MVTDARPTLQPSYVLGRPRRERGDPPVHGQGPWGDGMGSHQVKNTGVTVINGGRSATRALRASC
jgi:hypothetical protein